jgi:hypothetical protein
VKEVRTGGSCLFQSNGPLPLAVRLLLPVLRLLLLIFYVRDVNLLIREVCREVIGLTEGEEVVDDGSQFGHGLCLSLGLTKKGRVAGAHIPLMLWA